MAHVYILSYYPWFSLSCNWKLTLEGVVEVLGVEKRPVYFIS